MSLPPGDKTSRAGAGAFLLVKHVPRNVPFHCHKPSAHGERWARLHGYALSGKGLEITTRVSARSDACPANMRSSPESRYFEFRLCPFQISTLPSRPLDKQESKPTFCPCLDLPAYGFIPRGFRILLPIQAPCSFSASLTYSRHITCFSTFSLSS